MSESNLWMSSGLDIDLENIQTQNSTQPILKINNIAGNLIKYSDREYSLLTSDITNALKLIDQLEYHIVLSFDNNIIKTNSLTDFNTAFEMLGTKLKVTLEKK